MDIEYPIRINKLLSLLGICSRREADRLIEEGRIELNGRPLLPGDKVSPGDRLFLDGKEIDLEMSSEPVLLAFNKPRGLVCTSSDKDRAPNIIDYIGYPTHIYPIGRLDKDSEGLILLTNMGELVNSINKRAGGHEKEYEVELDRDIDERFIKRLRSGVMIEVPDRGRVRAGCKYAERTGKNRLRIILTEGMNRQIRRMCGALGAKVIRLRRIRVMNIHLGSLRPGEYRRVEGAELAELLKEVRGA